MALMKKGKNTSGRKVLYDGDKCLLCRRCITACKAGAISLDGVNRIWTQDPDKCTGSGRCVKKCPGKALRFA